MRLTRHTDYAFRVLIYVAVAGERRVTIREIASRYGLSRDHLMKVCHELRRLGFLAATRGRGGGIRLARLPSEIGVGAVVRAMEKDLTLVQCVSRDGRCRIAGACRLEHLLIEAVAAFFAVLDGYSLADVLAQPARLERLLSRSAIVPSRLEA